MKPSLAKLKTAIQQSQKNSKLFEDCLFLMLFTDLKLQIFFMYSLLCFTVGEAKYATVRSENRTLYEDNNFHSENEDVVETFPNTSEQIQGFSQPAFSLLEPVLKASPMSSAVIGLTKVSCFICFLKFFPL